MNNIRGGQRVKREKEMEWENWEKEKTHRIAKLHKLQKKLNKEVGVKGVTQKHVEQVKLGDSGEMVVSVIDGLKNKEGYTRLEEIPSRSESLADLREHQEKLPNENCCGCSLM